MTLVELDAAQQQAREAEEYILGALLLDAGAMDRVAEILHAASFASENHREIFAACETCHERGEVIDPATVAEKLRARGVYERVGGPARLHQLRENCPTAANVEPYARMVAHGALRRNLGRIGAEVATRARAMDEDPEEILKGAEESLFDLAERGATLEWADASQLVPEVLKQIHGRREGNLVGLATGFRDIDSQVGGMRPQEVYIVAGRPGMGKTSWALQVAANVAAAGTPVAVFSLEMSRDQMAERVLCQEARVDAHRAQSGELSDEEISQLTAAGGPVADLPLVIDSAHTLDEVSLRERSRRLRRSHGIGLVVVDYLQLVRRRGKSEGIVTDTTKVSLALKQIARELQVPVLAASQLSRGPEGRPDKKPELSDLRESGGIEQDAAAVLLLWREDYYLGRKSTKSGICTVRIAKNRFGPHGVDRDLLFQAKYCRFDDLERHHQFGPGVQE